jgi:hypothetical protein
MAPVMPRRRLLALLLLALWMSAGPYASTEPAAVRESALTLDEVISADPRDSVGACRNVAYGDSVPVGRSASLSPNPAGPTTVAILLYIIAIDQIETETSSFRFEGYGGLVWCDPRLRFDAEEEGAEFKVFGEDNALAQFDRMWWPGVVLPTQLGVPERTSRLVIVFSDGTVRFSTKFNSRMIEQYDFSDFPLDRHVLQIPIQTFGWNKSELVLASGGNRVGFDREFKIPEWNTLDVRSRIETRDGIQRFVTEIEIGREVGFYLWKILLPLAIIACVAWSTFWLTRDVLAQRQRQSATAILSVVAYQFVAAASLPRVSYLTLMDRIILWIYICIGLTLVTNVVHKRRFRLDEERGLRADRLWRVLYPLLCGGGVALIFLFDRLF